MAPDLPGARKIIHRHSYPESDEMSNFEQTVKRKILNARTGVLSLFVDMKFCLAIKFFT
jgi:hypothetical protein